MAEASARGNTVEDGMAVAAGFGKDFDAPTLAGSGLVANRNDPRAAMAAKLMENQLPAEIPGQGATAAAALGGLAKAFAVHRLLTGIKDDRDEAQSQEDQRKADEANEAMEFQTGTGRYAAPGAAAPSPAPSAPPATPSGGAPDTGPITPPANLLPIYQQAAKDSGVPLTHLVAQGYQESGFRADAKGKAGENGIAQILPSTGARPGYDMQPISEADALLPEKAIPWQAQYLAARAKAAGVTDWSDPAQAAKGLAAYNGTGPGAAQYAQTVLGHLPRVRLPGDGSPAPSGSAPAPAPTAPPTFQEIVPASVRRLPADEQFPPAAAPPAAPVPAPGLAPSGPQLAAPLLANSPTASPAPSMGPAMAARVSPDTVAGMQARADAAAASTNPLISRQAPLLASRAAAAQRQLDQQTASQERMQDRSDRDRMRADDRQFARDQAQANRNPMTRDITDPDGKVGTYVVNPDGSKGARIGDAANQRPEPSPRNTVTKDLMDPDGKIGTYVVNPDGSKGARIGDAANQRPDPTPRNAVTKDLMDPDGKGVGTYVVNPDGTLGNRLGSAAREAPRPDKALSDGVTKGIMGNMSSLRQIDQAMEAVGKNPGAFGNYERNLPLVGAVEDRMAPQANIDARAQVANIGSLKLHERSGAAVTAAEFPRLAPFVPSATDTPETVATKLQGMRRIVQEQLQDQYDTYGPGTGYRPVPGHARALGLDDAPPAGPGSVKGSGPALDAEPPAPQHQPAPAAAAVSGAPPAPPSATPPPPDPVPAGRPDALLVPQLPMVSQGGRMVPNADMLKDGRQYRLPNGTIATFDARRQTFVAE